MRGRAGEIEIERKIKNVIIIVLVVINTKTLYSNPVNIVVLVIINTKLIPKLFLHAPARSALQ
jgi:hypothetical protein